MDPPTTQRKAPYVATDMDDIQRLLNLEAMCRFQADAQNVQRIMQEKSLQWLDAKYEFQQEYARLARLIKCVGMRVAVDSSSEVDKENSVRTLEVLKNLRAKIDGNVRPANLNVNVVEMCQQKLDTVHKPRLELSREKREFAEIQEALQDLRTAVDGLENGFEINTLRAMDQMVGELLPARK